MTENTEKCSKNTNFSTKRGKKIWELIPNPLGGRPRLFTNPVTLWRKFISYCKWVDENPWEDKNASNSLTSTGVDNTNSMRQNVKVYQRAYTIYGFAAYSGIYKWSSFKQKYYKVDDSGVTVDGFSAVIDAIETSIRSQQVDGAIIRQFDSNLVARLNGLADKKITEVTGKDGNDLFKLPKLSSKDFEELQRINAGL